MVYPEFIEKYMFELTSGQYVSCLSDEDNKKDLSSKTLLVLDVILDYCNTFYNGSSGPINNWYSNLRINTLLNTVLPYMYIKDYSDKEIANLIFETFKKTNQKFALENFVCIVGRREGSVYKRFLKLTDICDELIDLIYENYNENTMQDIVPLLLTIDGLIELKNMGISVSSSKDSNDYENNSSVVVSMIIGLITNMDKKSFKFLANFNNDEIPFKEKSTIDINDEIISNLFSNKIERLKQIINYYNEFEVFRPSVIEGGNSSEGRPIDWPARFVKEDLEVINVFFNENINEKPLSDISEHIKRNLLVPIERELKYRKEELGLNY